MDVIPRILDLAREWIGAAVRPGDLAIDATVGNGHDTAFLANRVGPEGRVVGLDIQRSALERTAARLARLGLRDRVELVEQGHEHLDAWFQASGVSARPRAVMFNLGYLPGGDHAVITRPSTTLLALDAALSLVSADGLITVVAYPGHPGGPEELGAVMEWARSLPAHQAHAVCHRALNTSKPAPVLVAIARHEPDWHRVRGSG
jgi:hypothetical protein